MAETNEPRALSAALAAPAFATRGAGLAMHAANRHVERWAPEAGANRVRPMRSLGFVDQLIAPWIETAQRSASMRVFDQYAQAGFGERPPGAVSWVFPRPWYQDELDWMAAARRAPQQEAALLTTRGTYVAAQQAQQAGSVRSAAMAMPAALYEYVAPSMSIAQPSVVAGVGYGAEAVHADAYSPLIPLAAVQAAHLMARTVAPALAPATSGARMSPALRSVLSAMIERAAVARADEPSRLAMAAPELVTPPAPRPSEAADAAAQPVQTREAAAERVAEHYAAQRAQIVELQRIAQRTAERELAARAADAAAKSAAAAASSAPAAGAAAATAAAAAGTTAVGAERAAEVREAARRAEAQLRETAAARASAETQLRETAARASAEEQRVRIEAERAAAVSAERSRLEERVAQRTAERTSAQRLHEQARTAAAEHARAAIAAPLAPAPVTAATPAPAAVRRPPPEVASAIAALPPELAAFIGQRPDRAMQAIEELDVALRTIELIARGAATGASFEATRGPRLVMPAGLGGLVAAVDRTTASPWLGGARAAGEQAGSSAVAAAALSAELDAVTASGTAPTGAAPGARAPVARPFVAPALAAATRVPALPWLASAATRPIGAAAAAPDAATPVATSALAATAAAAPAALAHVAWADRWLARFAGASKASLETLTAPARMEALAAAAPTGVLVSPTFDVERDAAPARNVDRLLAMAERRPTLIPPPAPVVRYADDAETPDDVFADIAAAASRQRVQPAAPSAGSAPRAAAGVAASAGTSSAASAGAGYAAGASYAASASYAAGASPSRAGAAAAALGAGAPPAAVMVAIPDLTPADMIAVSAPAAPTAGLSAQLAASPFASALRHILPMPSATSFDVRSLLGGGLSATYLAGLLSDASRERELVTSKLPSWSSPALEGFTGDRGERAVPEWDAAYVAPSEPDAEAIAARMSDEGIAARLGDEVAARLGADAASIYQPSYQPSRGDTVAADLPVARSGEASIDPSYPSYPSLRGDAAAADLPAARSGEASFEPAAATAAVAAAERAAQATAASLTQIMTLRTALLSWSGDAAPGAAGVPGVLGWLGIETAESGAMTTTGAAALSSTGAPVSAAREILESMSLPLLGDEVGTREHGAWMAPGMIASRAHSWSVAQERSTSDLALDFVTPELVLAARVYGLGPAEAAQAARLAIAGSGHLTAMAGTVDRAFLQAMAMDSDRRERLATLMTAYPVAALEAGAAPSGEARVSRGDIAAPAWVAPTGVAPTGVAPTGVAPTGAELTAAASTVAELIGAAPSGAAPSGAAPSPAELTRVAPAFALAEQMSGGTAFGVDRRPPRGAFLWPSASVAALGLNAAVPDGQIAMSVAALELLAARAVAELGTFAALEVPSLGEVGRPGGTLGAAAGGALGATAAGGALGVAAGGALGAARLGGVLGFGAVPGAADEAGVAGFDPVFVEAAAAAGADGAAAAAALAGGAAADVASGTAGQAGAAVGEGLAVGGPARQYPFMPAGRRLDGGAALAGAAPGSLGEPGERDVLAAAGELVPSTRRARFEALYLALGQSTAGRSWSPAARAARALALAGQTEDVPISARARAAAAWDVLPIVFASEGLFDDATSISAAGALAAGAAAESAAAAFGAGARSLPAALGGRSLAAAGASTDEWVGGYAGPGLGALSARAGEALGAYVTPVATPAAAPVSSSMSSAEPSSSSRDREVGAVLRAPTAMQELVRTGRPAGRHGGGESEIPPWFEAAARKMFESQGTIADGITPADLTLVMAAPSTQLAASTRAQPSAAPQAPSAGAAAEKAAGGGGANNIDVEATAQEIYQYILTLMDAARARNGEPYL